MWKILSLLLGTVSLFSATFAQAQPVNIPTARGEVTLETNPSPIAVFDLGSLDTLQALGVKVDAVPEFVAGLPYLKPVFAQGKKVGTLFEPNMEALYNLKPALVIVGLRTAKKYEEIRQLAPTIDLTDQGNAVIEHALSRIDSLGALFAKTKEAQALHQEIETLYADTKSAVKNKGKGLIVMVNGNHVSAFGLDSRLGWIHSALGVPLVDESIKVGGHGQPISFEYIQKMNPDWLFVLDRLAAVGKEGQSAQQTLDNALVQQTTAWKKGQVIYLSAASYLAPGGVTQVKTDLTQIKNAFNQHK